MAIYDVRTGDFRIAHAPDELRSIGIGSCVVIILHDKEAEIAAMAHTMLPGKRPQDADNPHRYTDDAVDALLQALEADGADRNNLRATLIGGAQMFRSLKGSLKSVGTRNIEAAKNKLKQEDIRIIEEDTGGTKGRSVTFDIANGTCTD